MVLFLKHCFSSRKKILFSLFLLPLILIFWANFSVYYESKEYLSNDCSKMPKVKVGILLGTSRFLGNNFPNAYFFNRIDALDVRKHAGIKTKFREYFTCVKAYLEVKASVNPKFLGKEEKI